MKKLIELLGGPMIASQRRSFLLLVLLSLTVSVNLRARMTHESEGQTVLFNNLPRVALLVKEQYVDPKRIKPDSMLASILDSLSSRITKLVVTLPKTLEDALEESKVTDEVKALRTASPKSDATNTPDKATAAVKEQLVLDLGGTKKTFAFESQRSIWGMIFLLRDVFRFVEVEAKKQRLVEKSGVGEEPIDWEKIENGAINAMLSTLDPHSVYLEPKFARDLTLTTKGEFGGIGIVISVRDGFLTVISPIDGTPAAKMGVRAKDRILKIDDDSAINMDLNDAVNLLRGKPNSNVRITVQRPNKPKELDFTLTRAIIKVESVAYALIDNNVGYLRVKAFQGNTAQDVKNGILAMKKKSKDKMTGLIFDLRGNPGGLLREAVDVSNLFLDGGEVVSTQGSRPDSRQVELATAGELDPKLKIVVLADGGSASASEIVAGALKSGGTKNGRAIVVGERTFGKGSVQMLFDFPTLPKPTLKGAKNPPSPVAEVPEQPAALKLTIAEYFGPNNASMQTIGVNPDIGLSPVFAEKREELKLFPEVQPREEDLEGHLLTEKPAVAKAEEKPTANLEFLAPKADEEALEYSKLDVARLKKDFAVTVATEFIKEAKSISRSDLLANAQTIRNRLQKSEHKKIVDALKTYGIDWTEGTSHGKDSLSAIVTQNKTVVAGNKLKVAVKAKNTSKEPLYQVHAISHAKTPLFDQKEFLFGKLAPGQEIERVVEFDIPKDVVTRKDLMSLELRDYRREKMSELDVPLDIKGLGRPRFAHLVYVSDSRAGNGDADVVNGEDVELTVWLKNIGEGKAFEPTVLLKNESGSKVFLKQGRFQAKELLPNQETAMQFTFRVKEPTDKVNFEIQIFDGQMHDLWRDKIAINVADKAKPIKMSSKWLQLKSTRGELFDKPHAQAKRIAELKEGLKFEAIKEIGDYFLVKVDEHLSGYLKKGDVKDAPKDLKPSAEKKASLYVINYDRTPAQVALKFGDASGISTSETGKVVAEIGDVSRVSSILLFVNGKKVLYKDVTKKSGKDSLEHSIHLKPGVNVVTLFAGEDTTYGQRESITIFYDKEGRISKAVVPPSPPSKPTEKEKST